jgi:hypothetical protein
MPRSRSGLSPRMNLFLALLTFLTGIALAPVAWWREDAPIVALVALIPFAIHLRHGGGD